MKITRQQLVNRLRDANFTYSHQGDNAEIWRQKGTQRRVSVARRDNLPEAYVRTVLRQAGLTAEQVDAFWGAAVKNNDR